MYILTYLVIGIMYSETHDAHGRVSCVCVHVPYLELLLNIFFSYFISQFNLIACLHLLSLFLFLHFHGRKKNSFIHHILIKTHQLKRLATYKQTPTHTRAHKSQTYKYILYVIYYYYVDIEKGSN